MKILTLSLLLALMAGGSPLGLVACTPHASQGPQGPQTQRFSYSLPLRVTAAPECGEAEQLMYAVTADGSFSYLANDYNPFDPESSPPQLKRRQLSEAERDQIQALLRDANLARHFADATPVPEDAPQTMECRTVMQYALQVDGQTRSFDANGRKYQHSEAYHNAIQRLADALEALKSAGSPVAATDYSLPFSLGLFNECGNSTLIQSEVLADGQLRWNTAAEGQDPVYSSRQLSAAEQSRLLQALNDADLIAQEAAQERIPEDAPQTRECRMIEQIRLSHKGQSQTLDGQHSRRIRPGEAYLAAIESLKSLLMELRDDNQRPTG